MRNTSILDNLDRKILVELDINSKIPITQLAKRLRISREVAKYRLKCLIDGGIIKSFTTMINPAKLGFVIYKIYLKLQNLSLEKEKELHDYLVKHKKVFWLAKIDGAFDLIAGLYVKNTIEFDGFLSDFISKFGRQISSRHISNTVYSNPFRKKYLLDNSKEYEEIMWGGIPQAEKIDDVMLGILKLIAENSRIPISEICENLGTTAKTAVSKIRYMEKIGIILGYRIFLDLEKIKKENFKAIIYFQNINPEKEKRFKYFCEINPHVIYFIKTVGEWDVELDIEIDSYREFNRQINDIKIQFGDIIRRIDPVYISKELKGELNIVANI